MRGRRGVADVITKEDFINMYTSGMDFDDIGKKIGAKGSSIKEFFLENFLGFERFRLKKEHLKNIDGGACI